MSKLAEPSPSIWQKLEPSPVEMNSGPLRINGDEFLFVASECEEGQDGIYTYNIKKNEWTKTIGLQSALEMLTMESSAVDMETKTLFVCGTQPLGGYLRKRHIYKIDIAKCTMERFKCWDVDYDVEERASDIMMINDKWHVLIGTENKHFIVDKSHRYPDDNFTFQEVNFELQKERTQFVVYVKSQNIILRFAESGMEKFFLESSKWEKQQIALPHCLSVHQTAFVMNKTEEYIFMFGGQNNSDTIQIYDMKQTAFMERSLKCPEKEVYYAVSMCNEEEDELIVFGFVHQCFRSAEFKNIQPLPLHLIRVIQDYVSNESIHLIQRYGGDQHWKIHIDDLLQSII